MSSRLSLCFRPWALMCRSSGPRGSGTGVKSRTSSTSTSSTSTTRPAAAHRQHDQQHIVNTTSSTSTTRPAAHRQHDHQHIDKTTSSSTSTARRATIQQQHQQNSSSASTAAHPPLLSWTSSSSVGKRNISVPHTHPTAPSVALGSHGPLGHLGLPESPSQGRDSASGGALLGWTE